MLTLVPFATQNTLGERFMKDEGDIVSKDCQVAIHKIGGLNSRNVYLFAVLEVSACLVPSEVLE